MDYSGKIIRKTPVTPSQTSASGVWSLDEALQAQRTDTWPIANVPDPISRSLRFRQSASAYLNRTFGTPTNNKRWTYSTWIKRGALSTSGSSLFGQFTNSTNRADLYFDSANNLNFYNYVAGSFAPTPTWITTQVFRDPSAWYHIVLVWDSDNATAGDRIIIYVNGVRVTSYSQGGTVSSGQASQINSATGHNIARFQNDPTYFDGYITETQFIDGQALTPSSFGGTNAVTGVWEPRQYTGTYGTNGFYLPFSNITNTTTLGNDFSGNGNNWTTNNISLTAGSTYDSMLDVPTQWIGYNTGDVVSVTRGNYAVMNPVSKFVGGTVTNGNLTVTTATPGNDLGVDSSIVFPTSGKFYWEVTMSYSNDGSADRRTPLFISDAPPNTTALGNFIYSTGQTAAVNSNLGTVNSGLGSATTNGQTICFAYDIDNARVWMSKQANINTGTTATVTNFPNTNGLMRFQIREFSGTVTGTAQVNFGQRPFIYTPPAGFRSLCTTNLPSPTILQGDDYFNALLYTGNGSTQTITGLDFSPSLVWVKQRNGTGWNILTDAVRGVNRQLYSNSTLAEGTDTALITALNSNGFSVGYNGGTDVNGSGGTYVAWNWNAGGTTVTNTAGSISAQVRANTTAGFSIVTWTGNATNNSSVGHGLGTAPAIVIIKNRTDATTWYVKGNPSIIPAFTSQDQYLYLNLTNSIGTSSFNQTTVTSSLIQFPVAGNDTNGSGKAMVAYCFAPVAGYSAMGSYTGNGSSDGPFVNLGFRPRYVMIKSSSNTTLWYVYDSARNTFNLTTQILYPNLSDAEATGVNSVLDFVSNGFKIRDPGTGQLNISGATFIYAAFAENPFKNALAR